MHLKMSSAEVVCCKYLPKITDEFCLKANNVDHEQTAPTEAVWSGSTLFPHCLSYRLLKHSSRRKKQATFVAIGALRDKISSFVRIFKAHFKRKWDVLPTAACWCLVFPVKEQQRPWSNCAAAAAQFDHGLCCCHFQQGTFSHGDAAHCYTDDDE